jgi:hypothetical protein
VRVDPGKGDGHSEKVVTAGPSQKFGHPIEDMLAFATAARDVGVTVVGACSPVLLLPLLTAHSHFAVTLLSRRCNRAMSLSRRHPRPCRERHPRPGELGAAVQHTVVAPRPDTAVRQVMPPPRPL